MKTMYTCQVQAVLIHSQNVPGTHVFKNDFSVAMPCYRSNGGGGGGGMYGTFPVERTFKVQMATTARHRTICH